MTAPTTAAGRWLWKQGIQPRHIVKIEAEAREAGAAAERKRVLAALRHLPRLPGVVDWIGLERAIAILDADAPAAEGER